MPVATERSIYPCPIGQTQQALHTYTHKHSDNGTLHPVQHMYRYLYMYMYMYMYVYLQWIIITHVH